MTRRETGSETGTMNARSSAAHADPLHAPGLITKKDFFLPLAIIASLTLLTLTLGVHFAVRAFDSASEIREQTLAQNGVTKRIDEVALMVVPQADWDDAVSHLDNSYDPKWAEANIGSYLSATNGFNRSFVLDASNAVLFASADGTVLDASAYKPLAPLATNLIASVRAQERKRAPFSGLPSKKMISTPIQASSLKLVNGDLTIMTATLVQPDFGTALPRAQGAPIVLTTMPVDEAFLTLFSKRFLLHGLHVRKLNDPLPAGETEIAAKDETGATLAYFAWEPLNPGYTMLRQMVPPILAVCLVLGGVVFFQLRRLHKLSGQLIEREAHSRELAYHDPLTGLPNRNYFDEHLSWELDHFENGREALAIHYVRLTDLWQVAERFGYDARDHVVRIIASRLQAVCRSDSLLVRLSADEFAILSISNRGSDAHSLAKRLRQTLLSPAAIDGSQIDFRFQLGTGVTEMRIEPTDLFHEAILAAVQNDAGTGPASASSPVHSTR